VLAIYGFELCAECCGTIRVQTPLRLELEKEVKEAIIAVKCRIKEKIYSLTTK
jgi:hypothetical protein